MGWLGLVGNLQDYCRWLPEMPEVVGGWFCGRLVIGVGEVKEFEDLFHGVGFRSHRPQKNPVTHNDPHLKGPGSSRIGSRLWSIDPGSWSRQPIAPKKVAG